jgi:hypothetical protein
MDNEIFVKFILWTVVWSLCYIIVLSLPIALPKTISRTDELDFRNRVVSILHGLAVLFISGYHFFNFPTVCGNYNTNFEVNLIIMSVGYFTYDFLAMAYEGLLDLAMTLHHSVCIIGFALTLYDGHSASNVVGAMFIAEISNPSMHSRILLKHLHLRYTKAYEVCELSFLALYTTGRLILGSQSTYMIVTCSPARLLIKVCAIALLCQSIYFIRQMLMIGRKRIGEIANRSSQKISLQWWTPLTASQLKQLGLDKKERHFL